MAVTQSTCVDCGSSFARASGRGRPRIKCSSCNPRPIRIRPVAPRAKIAKDCATCSSQFSGNGNSRYCSPKCLNRAREARRAVPCTICGSDMYKSSRISTAPTCQPCRRARPGYRDRIQQGKDQHWTCGDCSAACSRPASRGQKPKWCDTCRRALQNRDIKIKPSARVSVYERDAWVCQICADPVDRSLIGSHSHWRPALDHVLPRSRGGSDDLSNLRLAHWWCNSALSDGRTYSPEDFRVPK